MKLSDLTNRKFIEQKNISDYQVLTETGFSDITVSNKTIKYNVYEVVLEGGISLRCADNHILIEENYEEVYAIKSFNKYIRTKEGIKKVIKITNLNIEENMYDLSVDSVEHTYYTNDILSHNTVTISCYLLFNALTRPNINIGVAANVVSLAQEVLDKIKKIYIELPIWLQLGVVTWNKQSIEFDNGTKIMISASNSDSFRGFSISLLYCDETAFIRSNLFQEFTDAVLPSITAIPDSQILFSSTARGLNFFYHMVQGAKTKVLHKATKDDIIKLDDGTDMNLEDYYKIYKQGKLNDIQ